MTVQLEFVVPSPDLAEHVMLFYHFRYAGPHFQDTERAGHAQLRFRLAGANSTYRFADGHVHTTTAVHLVGPTTGPMVSTAEGPIEVVGLGLSPAGWAALVRADASSMCNRAYDADDLFDTVLDLVEPLSAAPTTAAKIALVEDFLRRTIARAPNDAIAFSAHVDSWLAGDPSPCITQLEAATGLSRRQVERRCNALYGSPPKMLARKYRALRAAVAMVVDGEGVDDMLSRGFYDQSHLIREIKHFTGYTPRQLRTNPASLAHLTIGQRSELKGQVIPLVTQA